jgi:hypothetical protein
MYLLGAGIMHSINFNNHMVAIPRANAVEAKESLGASV